MDISETLLEKVKRKCYVTDTSNLTIERLKDVISQCSVRLKRILGISYEFDFEEEGNEEELALLLNYCWYDWNDSANEFKTNYLDDINSLHQKYEVQQYAEEESE